MINDLRLKIQTYAANGGTELFISLEEPGLDKLVTLCRLRFPDPLAPQIFEELHGAAIVRELRAAGYRYVTLDLQGYRTGSLNEGLLLRAVSTETQ